MEEARTRRLRAARLPSRLTAPFALRSKPHRARHSVVFPRAVAAGEGDDFAGAQVHVGLAHHWAPAVVDRQPPCRERDAAAPRRGDGVVRGRDIVEVARAQSHGNQLLRTERRELAGVHDA